MKNEKLYIYLIRNRTLREIRIRTLTTYRSYPSNTSRRLNFAILINVKN